jgi:hypothetical protein
MNLFMYMCSCVMHTRDYYHFSNYFIYQIDQSKDFMIIKFENSIHLVLDTINYPSISSFELFYWIIRL